MSDEKRLPFAGYTTRLVFGVLLAREQAPDWGWGGDGREKIGERSEPRIVVWGGERVVEPGLPLMPQNRPTAIYYVKTSSFHGCQREPVMSLFWGYLNSRCSKSASKEIYLTSIANWSITLACSRRSDLGDNAKWCERKKQTNKQKNRKSNNSFGEEK